MDYLKFSTAIPVKVIEVKPNEFKGKHSIVVVLEGINRPELVGRRLDAKFMKEADGKFNPITVKQIAKLFKVCGVTKFSELPNKELGIQINISEYKNKRFYNPSGFSPISHTKEPSVDDISGMDFDSVDLGEMESKAQDKLEVEDIPF